MARAGRSRLWLIGAALLAAAILAAWFPGSALFHQRASLAAASAQLSQLHREDAALDQERKNLSSSAEIARIAREQYQLVSPGQQAYEVLPPSGSAATGTPYAGDPGSATPSAPTAASVLPAGGVTSTTLPGAHAASSGHHAATSEGTLARMLHALEFWR